MKKLILILSALSFFTSCSIVSQKLNIEGVKNDKKYFTPAWIKNLDPEYQTGNMPIGLSSPLIFEDNVFVGTSLGTLDAYSLKNGRLLWQEKIIQGMNSAPIVYENTLIYGDISGRVYAKDLGSLEFKYQFDLGSSVDSMLAVSKGRLFVQTRNHKVFSIDILTGKILWSYKRSVPYFSTLQRTGTPLIVENRVYTGFADGHLLAFSLEDGQVLWEKRMTTNDKFVDVDMTPIYYRGKIIVSSISGLAEVLDPQSGNLYKRLNFTLNRDALYFDDKLLLGTIDGRIILLDSSFDIQKEVKVFNQPISNINLWKQGLVVTSIGKKMIYLDRSFNQLEKFDFGTGNSAIFGGPSIINDNLAVMSSRNRLYLFK